MGEFKDVGRYLKIVGFIGSGVLAFTAGYFTHLPGVSQ
jgi:hypothetical protein